MAFAFESVAMPTDKVSTQDVKIQGTEEVDGRGADLRSLLRPLGLKVKVTHQGMEGLSPNILLLSEESFITQFSHCGQGEEPEA